MKDRCSNPRTASYPDYGGRGIKVCDEWLEWVPFRDYLDKVLGPQPSKRHSLDRIDNDGNYEPGNIQWASPAEQATNQRPRRTLEDARAEALSLASEYELLEELKRRSGVPTWEASLASTP